MVAQVSKHVEDAPLSRTPEHLQFEPQPPDHPISMPVTQFINLVDAPSLDKTSRTTVRVQAMHDYHRRRVSAKGKAVPVRRPPPPIVLSAKAQTQKFRLGREKVLRPWVAVKSKLGRRQAAELSLQNKVHDQRQEADQEVKVQYTLDVQDESKLLGSFQGLSAEDVVVARLPSRTESEVEQSSPVYDFFLPVATLYDSPSSGRVDPFAAMSLLITPRTQMLMHHYFKVRLQSAWLMMPMRKTLFSLAIHDPAMFHSFLTHYATAYNVRFNTGNNTETICHANMAARLINERLADSTKALSDETIATVANMAAHEASNGVVASMIVHMDGLEQMVRMRGGIEGGGFAMIVQRMIGWADFHVATTLLQKPRFPPLNLPHMQSPDSNSSSHLRTDLDRLGRVNPPGLDILFSGLRALSSTLRTLPWQTTTSPDDISYSDRVYYLQRHLFDIAQDTSYHAPLDSVCALAALMYCGYRLRDIPFAYARVSNAVTRLKDAIEEYEGSHLWVGDGKLATKMIWLSAFGGVASQGKPERTWFAERFRMCCENLLISDWVGAKMVLDSVLWERELDEGGVRLWNESKSRTYTA